MLLGASSFSVARSPRCLVLRRYVCSVFEFQSYNMVRQSQAGRYQQQQRKCDNYLYVQLLPDAGVACRLELSFPLVPVAKLACLRFSRASLDSGVVMIHRPYHYVHVLDIPKLLPRSISPSMKSFCLIVHRKRATYTHDKSVSENPACSSISRSKISPFSIHFRLREEKGGWT
ncbi:hypothetical protein CVT26_007930 [Gymnopilus dilepis]|uniref:Uncharacterized protein n=1 Tax=Gymnopilus dilepis TaxID=231916 RepID=A0A409WWB1_9AGAR|nr:hypothetical protein CVT26_007930 [Gymnopilus dilepis]